MTKKHLFALIACMVLFLAIFSYCVSSLTQPAVGRGVKLDSYVSIDVYRADGAMEHYDSNYFGPVQKGDRLRITIPLPMEMKLSPAVIFFSVYQCELRLSYHGNVLYDYGDREISTGAAIGNVLVTATVPDEAWGDELTLDCLVTDYCDFSKLSDVVVCDARNSIRYLVGDKIPSYLLSTQYLLYFPFFSLPFCFGKTAESYGIKACICLLFVWA